jgi:creatinine amidohydrolase/Fe(II)-dependent formamide hydrolase-like protein
MTHILFELEAFGFQCVVAIPGHYPLHGPLQMAIERFHLEGGKTDVFIIYDKFFKDDGSAGDHAGAFETSLMMSMHPELVELGRLDPDLSKPNIGVGGDDPRTHASKEFGDEILAKFDSQLEAHLRDLGLWKGMK